MSEEPRIFSPRLFPRLDTKYKMIRMEIHRSPVHIFQTADTRACIVGCLKYKGEDLIFSPARKHLNGLRNLDLDITTHLMMLSPEYKTSFNGYDPRIDSMGAMLLREPIAQNPFLNSSLANINTPFYLIMDVHHVVDAHGIKGKSGKISHYRLDLPDDEVSAKEIQTSIKHAFLVDSIAGGRNLLVAIEELKRLFHNLEKVNVVSVFATYQGIKRISKKCSKKLGIETEFFIFHELLDVNPVNEYDCFFPDMAQDHRDVELMKLVYGDKYRQICVGGDFTANIYGRAQAKAVWKEQIQALGYNDLDIPVSTITPAVLRDLGYEFDDIVPYSTIWTALEKGCDINNLKEIYLNS